MAEILLYLSCVGAQNLPRLVPDLVTDRRVFLHRLAPLHNRRCEEAT